MSKIPISVLPIALDFIARIIVASIYLLDVIQGMLFWLLQLLIVPLSFVCTFSCFYRLRGGIFKINLEVKASRGGMALVGIAALSFGSIFFFLYPRLHIGLRLFDALGIFVIYGFFLLVLQKLQQRVATTRLEPAGPDWHSLRQQMMHALLMGQGNGPHNALQATQESDDTSVFMEYQSLKRPDLSPEAKGILDSLGDGKSLQFRGSDEELEELKRHHPNFEGNWEELRLFLDLVDKGQLSSVSKELPFWEPNLSGADFYNLNLPGASLERSVLVGTRLFQANLEKARLSHSTLDGANFNVANLTDANLEYASLKNVNLHGATLEGAFLGFADLSGADLSMAKLSRCSLRQANLKGANLRGADLSHADLQGAKFFELNENLVNGTRFSPHSKDIYSILRRNYTGFQFILLLGLTFLALFPYGVEIFFWSAVGEFQAKIQELSQPLLGDVKLGDPRSWGWHRTRVIFAVLGWTKGPITFALSIILLLYNGLRGFMTIRMNALQYEEERSHYAPPRKDYIYLWRLHRLLQILFFIALGTFCWNIGRLLWQPLYLP
jgi:uncharacterized protein YjbI with pentapeptide repeats